MFSRRANPDPKVWPNGLEVTVGFEEFVVSDQVSQNTEGSTSANTPVTF